MNLLTNSSPTEPKKMHQNINLFVPTEMYLEWYKKEMKGQ